jgi:diacylglycerol kinase family enzyme
VVATTNLGLKRKLGKIAYLHAILRNMIAYPFEEFLVVAQEGSAPAISCVAANAGKYGGGLVLTPQADIADGQLDVLVLGPTPKLELVKFLISSRLGRPTSPPFVRRLRTSALRIDGTPNVLVQVDGELAGTLPARITLAHKAISLIVPA